MSLKWSFFSAGCFFFIQFLIFSFLVHENLFTASDLYTTVYLQMTTAKEYDGIFSFFSEIGKFEIVSLVLLVLFVITKRYKAGIGAAALYVSFHLIELFGKYFVDHPPPPSSMLRTEQVLDFPQLHVASAFSYPSGHAGRALFLTAILLIFVWGAKRFPLWVKIGISIAVIAYDIVMMVSRVTLGEHWTTDVIGGALLGAACGLFVGIFLTEKKHKVVKFEK